MTLLSSSRMRVVELKILYLKRSHLSDRPKRYAILAALKFCQIGLAVKDRSKLLNQLSGHWHQSSCFRAAGFRTNMFVFRLLSSIFPTFQIDMESMSISFIPILNFPAAGKPVSELIPDSFGSHSDWGPCLRSSSARSFYLTPLWPFELDYYFQPTYNPCQTLSWVCLAIE